MPNLSQNFLSTLAPNGKAHRKLNRFPSGNILPVVFSTLGTCMVSAHTSSTWHHDYYIHKVLGPGYWEFPWLFCETTVGKLRPKVTGFGYFVKTLAKIVLSKNKRKHTKNIYLLTIYISNAFRYKTYNSLLTYKLTALKQLQFFFTAELFLH